MKKAEVTIVGIRPMISHNGRLADPLDPFAKALSEVAKKRKKSDDDHELMAEREWLGGIYWSEELDVYVPSDNLEACFVNGAKKTRLGKNAMAALFVDAEYGVPIELPEGIAKPKTLDAMRADPRFSIRKGVRVQQNRVMRTRPMVPTGWRLTFDVEFDEGVLNLGDVERIIHDSGQYIGLGDWRPKFGRFIVERFKEKK